METRPGKGILIDEEDEDDEEDDDDDIKEEDDDDIDDGAIDVKEDIGENLHKVNILNVHYKKLPLFFVVKSVLFQNKK